MEDVSYHDFHPGMFYSPPGPDPSHMFHTPFHTPPEYLNSSDGYTHMESAHSDVPRTLAQPFVYQTITSHRGGLPISPPVAPPVTAPFFPSRQPAVPISPSQTTPKAKAKRTPTVSKQGPA